MALVDVHMPGDGLVLLDRQADTPQWSGTAILMTGDQSLPRVREEISAGRPHLAKRFDMMEAVRLIERLSRPTSAPAEKKVGACTSS